MRKSLLIFLLLAYSGLSAQTHHIPSGYIAPGNHTITSNQVIVDFNHRGEVGLGAHINYTTNILNVGVEYLTFEEVFTIPFIPKFGLPGWNSDRFNINSDLIITGTNALIVFDTVAFEGTGKHAYIDNFFLGSERNENSIGAPPGGIMVTSKLTFNNGITRTNRDNFADGAIVLFNNAPVIGGLTNGQHVDGFVSETNSEQNAEPRGHNGSFTFPVGTGTKAYPLKREGIFTETERVLTVGYISFNPVLDENPNYAANSLVMENTVPEIGSVFQGGYWGWHYMDIYGLSDTYSSARGMDNDQTITVNIPSLSSYGGVMNAGNLILIGFDISSNSWIDLSTGSGLPTPYATGLTEGSALSGVIPAGIPIIAIGIGSTNMALPVEFKSFTARVENCATLLSWETAMEHNNNYFLVERSHDGRNFERVASVQGSGNSNTVRQYSYKDEFVGSGVYFYRITQVDFDGRRSSTASKRIDLNCNQQRLSIFPNPTNGQLTIQTAKTVKQVNILSVGGAAVLKFSPPGSNYLQLNLRNLANGIYILQIVNQDGTVEHRKILKQ